MNELPAEADGILDGGETLATWLANDIGLARGHALITGQAWSTDSFGLLNRRGRCWGPGAVGGDSPRKRQQNGEPARPRAPGEFARALELR